MNPLLDKVKEFVADNTTLPAFFDAKIGMRGGKTVASPAGPQESTGLVKVNLTPSHDDIKGNEDIDKGIASTAAAAGSDWAKAMWEVRVTCIGIPEISGQHELQRLVTLNVPSPRGGAGSSRLSGEYLVHDYEHHINASDGFKTTLVLKGFPG